MARVGVSEKDVQQVIRQLEAKGLQPTVNLVRKELGTECFSTISAILTAWKADQQRSVRPAAQPIPDDVAALFQQLWREAFRSADSVAEGEREKFLKDRLALEKPLSEMTAEITRLEEMILATQKKTGHSKANVG